MKIAHLVDNLEVGGAEVLVASLARAHLQAGHEVTVYCLFSEGPLAERLRNEGSAVSLLGPGRRWQLIRRVYRECRRNRPDIFHCHNSAATVLGAPAARIAGVPGVLCTRHGLGDLQSSAGRIQFWTAAWFCDRVVAVCSAARKRLSSNRWAVPKKLVTLLNGASPAPLRGGAPVARHGFTVVHVARLAWYKDQAVLLRAIDICRRTVPDVRLWVIGDGPERPSLVALTEQLELTDRVDFLGEREDVGRWLAAADLFVLSSMSEGMPVSLLESMAAGLPAVVTNTGGMPEVLALSGAGCVVPSGCPEALAEAIVGYARQRPALPALGARARQCYEKHFTIERMADDYLRLYRQCLTGNGVAGQTTSAGEP